MKRNGKQKRMEPAQPLLPRVNLVQCLMDRRNWCKCKCDGCPPWDHPENEHRCLVDTGDEKSKLGML